MTWELKYSQLDASVNFSRPLGSSIVECRFVQRDPSQVIVYLSSHAGCLQACRFCHLTATGQTDETPVDLQGFVDQLEIVLLYWATQKRTGKETHLNINWMARGEPLNNPTLVNHWDQLMERFQRVIAPYGLQTKFNISTIYPEVFQRTLVESFSGPVRPHIYYSLYSLDRKFRKRWLPKAQEPKKIINDLKNFASVGNLVVHQAFIQGQNDSLEEIQQMLEFLHTNIPRAKINTVRYNPYSERHGTESNALEEIQRLINEQFVGQLVPRVGEDVAASCGCFLNHA